MNKALYFPIFVNDYDELQLTTLKRKFGIKGYGIYTFLRTKLQDIDNYEYPIELIPDLAYLAGVSEPEMHDIIFDSGLFIVGNEYFSCPLLDEALERHNLRKAKKSEQGKAGGKARMSTMTSEERKKFSQKAHEARYGKIPENGIKSDVVPADRTNTRNIPDIVPAQKVTAGSNAGSAGNNLPANAGNLPDNEIEIESDIEIDIKKEKNTEIKTEMESKTETTNKAEKELIYFNPTEVNGQIIRYKETPSKFFTDENKEIVVNIFNEYYKVYPKTRIEIERFERLVYVYLITSFSSLNIILENSTDLDDYIKNNNFTILPSNINNLVQMLSNNLEVREVFNNIISKA